ncbi:MAG: sensor histidine kinase, partial [Pseudolabrys sp.]
PMVFTAVDQRRVQYSSLTANDAVVALRINYLSAFENILQVLPDTKDVIVVVGTSPIEKFWKEAIGKEVEPLADRIKLSWTDELSFEALLKQASALSRHTAIFWELMIVDAAGVVHEGDVPLTRLHAVANAPIFSYDESFFGNAIVGGPLLLAADTGRLTAAAAIRILNGEKPGEIRTLVQFASPVFDWREMRRWGISESRLPAGSEVLFRSPTAWEQYRWQVLIIAAVILTQTLLILGLLYEHQRRRRAEVQSLQRMAELAHLNRVATAGELSASIAHEVKQPLAAVVAQSSAALRWLAHTTPDLNEARAALKKIVFAGNRASEIVDNLRSMFRKESSARRPLDINDLITDVIGLTSHEAQKHSILVHTTFSEAPKPQTLGDQAQLEQVFLNLVMNAIEAMNSSKSDHRVLELKTSVNEGHEVLVTVADSGPGVDAENLEKIFDAFFTTKPDGMGMGLSICRSIIESHGGRLWALPGDPGLIFCVSLPSVGR